MTFNPMVFRAVLGKELNETRGSLVGTLALTVGACVTVQFFSLQSLVGLELPPDVRAQQAGIVTMYLVVMAMIFSGQVLSTRFFHDERHLGIVGVLLASGLDKRSLYLGKVAAIAVLSLATTAASVVGYVLVAGLRFGVWPAFTPLSATLVFVTFPILSLGVVALISVSYWWFRKMAAFNMIFPIAALMGMWYLSSMLVGISVPAALGAVSLVAGLVGLFGALRLVDALPNERVATKAS